MVHYHLLHCMKANDSQKKQRTNKSCNVHCGRAKQNNNRNAIATVLRLRRQQLQRYLWYRYRGFWVRQCLVSCPIIFMLHLTITTYIYTSFPHPLKYNSHFTFQTDWFDKSWKLLMRIWEVCSFLGGLLMQFSPTLRLGARPNVGEEVYTHYGVSNRLSHPWLVYCSPPPHVICVLLSGF